jgi:hypothetical protein
MDRFYNAKSQETVTLEKIHKYNNLQYLSWLDEAIRLARTVGRIAIPGVGYGTGWLISEDLALTNNHVIERSPRPGSCWIEFNYEIDWKGNKAPVDRYEILELVGTNAQLDYSIVRIKDRPGEKYGFNNILDAKRPSLDSSAARFPVIIQHPQGGYKKIALTENELWTLDETYVWYTTDTEPGSSGSPVYDQLWRPFALHHAGGPKRLDDGTMVILNEGIILERIVADARDVLGTRETLTTIMGDLLKSEVFSRDLDNLDLEWYIKNPRVDQAIRLEAKGDDELAGVLAAAAGVAAGAAAAHWAHVTSKRESLNERVSIKLGVSIDLEIQEPEKYSQNEMFQHIYNHLTGEDNREEMKRLIEQELRKEAVGTLAGIFLAGVAAGAAAYKAGK